MKHVLFHSLRSVFVYGVHHKMLIKDRKKFHIEGESKLKSLEVWSLWKLAGIYLFSFK